MMESHPSTCSRSRIVIGEVAPRVRRGIKDALPVVLIISKVTQNRGLRRRAADSALFFIFAGRKARLRLSELAESLARGAGNPRTRETKYLKLGSDRFQFAASGVKKRTR